MFLRASCRAFSASRNGRAVLATALFVRNRHLAAVLLKHSDSRLVQPRKADVRNAAGDKSHPVAPLAFRRKDFPSWPKKNGTSADGVSRSIRSRSPNAFNRPVSRTSLRNPLASYR